MKLSCISRGRRTATVSTIVVSVALSIAAVGCGEDDPQVDLGDGDELAVSSVTYNLYNLMKAAGVPVAIGDRVISPYFPGEGRALMIHRQAVGVFEYDDPGDIDEFVTKTDPAAGELGGKRVTGGPPVNLFRTSRLLILYRGDEERVISALSDAAEPVASWAPAQSE